MDERSYLIGCNMDTLPTMHQIPNFRILIFVRPNKHSKGLFLLKRYVSNHVSSIVSRRSILAIIGSTFNLRMSPLFLNYYRHAFKLVTVYTTSDTSWKYHDYHHSFIPVHDIV